MSDDNTKRGAGDRDRVAAGEPYEVSYFARKQGITREQAEHVIRQAEDSRTKADTAAEQLKRT